MHRKKSISGKLFLNGGKFERKSIDEIVIDGPEDFSPLNAIDVGHDNSGMAPGWFLDKVLDRLILKMIYKKSSIFFILSSVGR